MQEITDNETYSEGITFDIDTLSNITGKSTTITECNKIGKILDGNLFVQVMMEKGTDVNKIKTVIEKASGITNSFKPIMEVPTCGNCGFKDAKLAEKCPNCKSTYII